MKRMLLVVMLAVLAAAPAIAENARIREQIAPELGPRFIGGRPAVIRTGAANWQPVHQPFTGPMTAKKIQIAIDDAIMYLRSQQRPDGSIGHNGAGSTALAALAMLAAGADPASDGDLRKALDWLKKQSDDNTYVRGIRANTWEYALRKIPYDKTIRAGLKADFDWLLAATSKNPHAWRYHSRSGDWDNSCSQYGVLGIWAAQRAGFDPGDAFWQKMSKHFRWSQRPDGGWSYTTGGSTPNMATAGLASMFLVFDMYHGKSYYSAENPRAFTEGDAAAVLKSLDRGMIWLGKAQSGQKETAYYLYGIERAGVASGRKYFGGEDWFKRGALAVLKHQGGHGEINIGSYGGPVCRTSWCVLFLVYGGAPAAMNKLEYGGGSDWNLNPRDLANLSKHMWSAYERPLNWQTVNIDAPASEFEAPILFISGSKAAKFSEKEVLKLREYVDGGGTILAEPSDRSEAFADSMAELVRQMYPEHLYPSCKLRPLPADHEVYTVMKQQWEKRPELLGASDGSRTFFFLSKEYMSADWQVDKTKSDAFKLAMNLLFYATDLATLEGRFASILPETPAAKERDAVATVARIRHAGPKDAPRDWETGRRAWSVFAPYVKHVTGCTLEEKDAVELGKADLAGIRLLHLTGQRAVELSEKERAALKKYVEDGGTLLVDAYAGSEEFAASARREIKAAFGKLRPLAPDSVLASGRFEGGVDLSRGIRFKLPARRWLRDRGESPRGQKLEVIRVGNRPAVIFSSFDLTGAVAGIESFRSIGYKPASARRVAGNVLAYVMAD
ncbi:MAG: DUF4159 domain-containing protein [Planctomycetota bacterium]